MIRGSCHCGAVRFRLLEHREFLTDCNCSACRRGGTTHWLSTRKEVGSDEDRMAVNCRMAEPADIADLPIRHFDGADSWQYLD